MEEISWLTLCFLCFQVNGTEIEYEFEEITLERVSISDLTAVFNHRKSVRTFQYSEMVS